MHENKGIVFGDDVDVWNISIALSECSEKWCKAPLCLSDVENDRGVDFALMLFTANRIYKRARECDRKMRYVHI